MLFPSIVIFSLIGAHTINNITDVFITAGFMVFGYLSIKFDCEPAPTILGFLLGPLTEQNLRRSLIISDGDPRIFVTRPISLTLLLLTLALVLLIVLRKFSKTREVAFQES